MTRSAEFTQRFCYRWIEKADNYDDKSLDGVFDKFFSLYVAFNRLYSHLDLRSNGGRKGDKEQATTVFSRIVGAAKLERALQADDRYDDIHTLAALIAPGGGFHVCSVRGTHSRDDIENLNLHGRLVSNDVRTKVNALLEYLYRLRCNMFHGSKDFDEEQIQILQPATRCLRCVIYEGLNRLVGDAT